MYCDSQEKIRWSALSYKCASSSTPTTSSKDDQRVTEGTYFDWCKKEGCGNENVASENSYILRQKVSPSRRRQAIVDVDGCADLKLTELNKLKYTLTECDRKRKPLCLRGDPIINNQRKRMKKKRNRKNREKKT